MNEMADRDAEIALARTAPPTSISKDATVLVLGRHDHETAVDGKNGFVCLVERGWNGRFEGDKGFWNPTEPVTEFMVAVLQWSDGTPAH